MTMPLRYAYMISPLLLCGLWMQGTMLRGQTSASAITTDATTTNNPAIAVVQQAINAMGGQAWASIGAATVQITTVYPAPANKPASSPVTAFRSDDWSGEHAHHRTQASGDQGTSSVLVETEKFRAIKQGTGSYTLYPPNFDLVTLAQVYPGVALQLALSSRNCKFTLLPASDAQPAAVQQDCPIFIYPKHNSRMTWRFDSSGLPVQLEFPMLSADGKFVSYQKAEFQGFQQVQGLTIAQTVQIFVEHRPIKTFSLSSPSFSTSLADTTFSIN